MKALTCEMCGSTNLVKEGGVFVCQSCGTKYSVEEAKKIVNQVTGGLEQPDSGIMFAMPLTFVEGLVKKK